MLGDDDVVDTPLLPLQNRETQFNYNSVTINMEQLNGAQKQSQKADMIHQQMEGPQEADEINQQMEEPQEEADEINQQMEEPQEGANVINQQMEETQEADGIIVELLKAIRADRVGELSRIKNNLNITAMTPLTKHVNMVHLAAIYGSSRILLNLLNETEQNGGYVENGKWSPLHLAVWNLHETCTKILIERCPGLVNQKVNNDDNNDNNDDYINAQISEKIPEERAGTTPLHLAVKKGWKECIKWLLEVDANTDEHTNQEKTVVHIAVEEGHHEVLEELLNYRCIKNLVDRQDKARNTPLFMSIHKKNHTCLSVLLKHGATVDTKDKNGRSILHCAMEANCERIINVLMKRNGDNKYDTIINAKDRKGFTPLHLASKKSFTAGVNFLIDQRCNSGETVTEKMDNTDVKVNACYYAIQNDNCEILDKLLTDDSSLIHTAVCGNIMPLQYACMNRKRKVITTLINNGSDLLSTIPDEDNCTVIDLLLHRVPNSVELLKASMDRSFKIRKGKFIIDYKMLLPQSSNTSEMRIIDALVQTGDQVNQHSLFMHPLIESFLQIQWMKVSFLYYIILYIYMAFVLTFTTEVVLITLFNAPTKLRVASDILRVFIALISLIYIPHKCLYTYFQICTIICNGQCTFSKAQTYVYLKLIVKLLILLFSVTIIILIVVNPTEDHKYVRELYTSAMLLFWFELMSLWSPIPKYGFYMLMFFEVSKHFLIILSSFSFIIVGFTIAFIIEYHGEPPFYGTLDALLKTIVMMTNEYEYNELFNTVERYYVPSFTKLLFMLFLLFVGIVIMNIILAKAISDVKRVDRLLNFAKFLTVYNKVWSHLQKYLKKPKIVVTTINPKLEIEFNKVNIFPEKLMHSILQKVTDVKSNYQRQQSSISVHNEGQNSKTLDEVYKQIDTLNKKIDTIKEMIVQLSNSESFKVPRE